jgi:DNA (cytosine-5)-methyltransferase 1
MNKQLFKLGELFCGPGGMALGAKLASEKLFRNRTLKSLFDGEKPIRHIWGVDIDPDAIKTYQQNLAGEGLCVDAMAFTDPKGKQKGKPHISEYEKIDALAFGFPCNDFSMVGKQHGLKGKFGNLYQAGINAINHADPLFFVAENVSGIHSANSGKAFKKILKELAASGKHGYTITSHFFKLI